MPHSSFPTSRLLSIWKTSVCVYECLTILEKIYIREKESREKEKKTFFFFSSRTFSKIRYINNSMNITVLTRHIRSYLAVSWSILSSTLSSCSHVSNAKLGKTTTIQRQKSLMSLPSGMRKWRKGYWDSVFFFAYCLFFYFPSLTFFLRRLFFINISNIIKILWIGK